MKTFEFSYEVEEGRITFYTAEVLKNNNSQGPRGPQARWMSEASGRLKKVRPARTLPFFRAERTSVREHGKMARTPAATFLNRPTAELFIPLI